MEVAEAELEETARRIRRVLRAFRLIFYPGAAIVAFLLLTGGGGGELDGLRAGVTQQGYEFVAQFDGDRPIWFETSIRERCPTGHEFTQHWASTQRLEVRDGVFRAETKKPSAWSNGGTGELTMRLHARVDGDAVTGTLWVTNRIGGYVCAAGPVTFSAA